jgi:hypothetical protein
MKIWLNHDEQLIPLILHNQEKGVEVEDKIIEDYEAATKVFNMAIHTIEAAYIAAKGKN